MNLKNKTDKELWDMLEEWEGKGIALKWFHDVNKSEIHKEIIRREKERIKPYKDYVCDKLRREKDNDV